jgi:hypothetical protein
LFLAFFFFKFFSLVLNLLILELLIVGLLFIYFIKNVCIETLMVILIFSVIERLLGLTILFILLRTFSSDKTTRIIF